MSERKKIRKKITEIQGEDAMWYDDCGCVERGESDNCCGSLTGVGSVDFAFSLLQKDIEQGKTLEDGFMALKSLAKVKIPGYEIVAEIPTIKNFLEFCSFEVFELRDETDAEMKKRIKKEQTALNKKKAQFLKLKKELEAMEQAPIV